MNSKKISVLLQMVVICGILLACCSCGGGFSSDSENAPHYQNAIFGTDTLGY